MTAQVEFDRLIPDNPTPNCSPPHEIRLIPDHLRRRLLKERMERGEMVSENEWSQRGRAAEVYARDVIATQTHIVDHVDINEAWDAKGPDLRVYFVEGFPITDVGVEVKSSTHELIPAKRKTRDEIFEEESNGQLNGPWTMELSKAEWNLKTDQEKEAAISRRLTEQRKILINAGEKDNKEKTWEEILNDSFYPQLNRMVAAIGQGRGLTYSFLPVEVSLISS